MAKKTLEMKPTKRIIPKNEPIVRCTFDEMVPLSKLKAHPKNRNKHPEAQIERLAQILKYQGFRMPVRVSKASGFVTGGHGRIEAARLNGWEKVPVNYQEYESEEQEYADLVADNAIALWAELDLKSIGDDITPFGPEFDLNLLGLEDFVLDPSELRDGQSSEELYTKKIEAPIYEPKGEKPKIKDLFDAKKTEQLLESINESDLPAEEKEFLRIAAQRHTIFHYERVAEYYAHAPKPVQELMEDSALVIIDFNKAIESGFVVMSKEIAEVYPE